MALRHEHTDLFRGPKSFRYGSSTTNTVGAIVYVAITLVVILQRIESWWGQLRNSVTDYWINVFKARLKN